MCCQAGIALLVQAFEEHVCQQLQWVRADLLTDYQRVPFSKDPTVPPIQYAGQETQKRVQLHA
jgi:hypothetical protein